jgi:hypothetical protein
MGSAGGRAMRGRLPGLAQRRDGRRVALSARPLDVVRAFYRAGAASRERIGAPLVRAKSPSCRRRLVDRPPDERMAEAKAAGYVGLTDEVKAQEFVYGIQHRRLGSRRGGRRKLWVEGVSGNCCSLQREACPVCQERELFGQRGGNGGRYI